MVYVAGHGRESLSGSLSVSFMEQVVGMVCLGRLGRNMGDGWYVLYLVCVYGSVVCRAAGRN